MTTQSSQRIERLGSIPRQIAVMATDDHSRAHWPGGPAAYDAHIERMLAALTFSQLREYEAELLVLRFARPALVREVGQ